MLKLNLNNDFIKEFYVLGLILEVNQHPGTFSYYLISMSRPAVSEKVSWKVIDLAESGYLGCRSPSDVAAVHGTKGDADDTKIEEEVT